MERRTEELEMVEKTIVEGSLEDWNRKIKKIKCGEVTAERRKIYVENCEKAIRHKIRNEYEEASYEDKKRWKEKRKSWKLLRRLQQKQSWNRKTKKAKCGKVQTERRKIF